MLATHRLWILGVHATLDTKITISFDRNYFVLLRLLLDLFLVWKLVMHSIGTARCSCHRYTQAKNADTHLRLHESETSETILLAERNALQEIGMKFGVCLVANLHLRLASNQQS